MAKALLLNALQEVLSDYVVGLSSENLKIGVFSGKIAFDNLQVNPEAVNQLRLPVTIIHGTVKKLEVHIPWGHLGSRPVKVFLEGVTVLIGPLDKDSWDAKEVQARRLGIKRAWLQKTEEEALKKKDKVEDDSNKDKSFVDKLVQRIVDNIEINLSDIHFRYEDPTLVEGQTMSAGLTLKSFLVTTTDENFTPQFVDRTKDKKHHVKVHKVASVEGFSIYWRVDDQERFGTMPPGEIGEGLREFVTRQGVVPEGDNGGGLARGDLIRPTKAALKFIHNDDPDDQEGPKFEATFEMDDVKLDVRAEQYEQALTLKDSISALVNWQAFYPYRPKTSPMEDAKSWWRYAYVCVRGGPSGWMKVDKILTSRRQYVALYERVAATSRPENKKRAPPSFSKLGLLNKLDEEEQKRLDMLEEELPLETIIMFRAMARKKLARLRAEAEEQEEVEDEKKLNWWDKLWRKDEDKKRDGKEEQEEGDLSLEDLGADIDAAEESTMPSDYLQVRVRILPRLSLRLYGLRDLPLLEARVAMAALMELKEDTSLWVDFNLTQLDVLDLFTSGAVFPHVLRVWDREEVPKEDLSQVPHLGGDSLTKVSVLLSKEALSVDIRAVPTEIAYNREVVDAVVSVFQARPAETQAYLYGASKGLEKAQQKAQELVKLSISVSLNVAAPKVIIPVSSSSDKGFLLLDMGQAVVAGGTLEDGKSMSYAMEVSDITVRLPSEKALMQTGTDDALIRPFKIKADVNMDESGPNPNIAVAVDITPGVNGIVSPYRIRKLFGILDYVTKADLNQAGGEGSPPIGLTAPNTPAGGGTGVEIMGGDVLPVGRSAGDAAVLRHGSASADGEGDAEEAEKAVLMQIKLEISCISLLLVESETAIVSATVDKDDGLLMELRGMALELETSPVDLTVVLALETLTLEDRARPDDSPYRYMISTTPDERSHGRLIHVTYWGSTGGRARVPPAFAATDEPFNIVLDARFSTLKLALDRECIVTSTPFFRAITRKDEVEAQTLGQRALLGEDGAGAGAVSSTRLRRPGSKMDDAQSVVSVQQVVGVAKKVAGTGDGAPAILVKASLTSVSMELVRSDPWEPTMRAEVVELVAKFMSDGAENGDMEASVTLAAVALTDARPEARDNAYRGILVPILPSSQEALVGARDDEGQEEEGRGGEEKEVAPIMSVTAWKKGSQFDADVKLASFACNLMVEPIKESLVVVIGIQEAVTKMLAEEDGSGQHLVEDTVARRGSAVQLETVDEEAEDTLEGSASPKMPAVAEVGAVAVGAEEEKEGASRAVAEPSGAASSISARLALDDWRINIVEVPSDANCTVMVLRASMTAIFTRAVTPGDGGESTEDILHTSLSMESLVDQPTAGNGEGGTSLHNERKISQVLEPFSAEIHATLLSARNTMLSVSLHLAAEAMDSSISYKDVMLVQRLLEQATASADSLKSAPIKDDEFEELDGPGATPEAYAQVPVTPTANAAELEASRASAAAPAGEGQQRLSASVLESGAQPETMLAISVTATCSMARVVLVNDYEKQDVPVLSFAARQLKAEGSGFKSDFRVEVSGDFQASSYNVGVVCWEPLVEPWRPQLRGSLAHIDGKTSLKVELTCEQVLLVNVTAAFLEYFLSTSWMLFSDGGAKDDPMQGILGKRDMADDDDDDTTEIQSVTTRSSSPELGEVKTLALEWGDEAKPLEGVKEGSIFLNNRSGLPLVVSTSDQPEKSVDVGPLETVPLQFKPQRHYDPRVGESDLRGKAALVKWKGEDGGLEGTRDELPPLSMDKLGTFVYPLNPVDAVPAGYVVSAPVVVEVYQDQRYHLTKKWAAPYMPRDGPEFWTKQEWSSGSSSGIRETSLDSFALPNDSWEWRDEWHVDFSKEVGKEIDSTGWEYSVEFSGFNMEKPSRTHREMDQARRRKWIRTRAPKPLQYDDPFRPLHLVWEVTATPQGHMEATIRSTVQIANKTDIPLDMRALSSVWERMEDESGAEDIATGKFGARPLGTVDPGMTLDVPVKMVYANVLQLRPSASAAPVPATSGGDLAVAEAAGEASYGWSAPIPLLVNHVDEEWDRWVKCSAKGPGPAKGEAAAGVVRLVVHAETSENGCMLITVLPPVAVVNCLPCPMSFRARSSHAESGSDCKVLDSGMVPTAETVFLYQLEVGDGSSLSVKIGHHGWSNDVVVLPSGRAKLREGHWAKRKVSFKLPTGSGDGGLLEIRCQLETVKGPTCPAVYLNMYCSHWLVDRTGLRLGFGVSEEKRLPVPRPKPSAVTAEQPNALVRYQSSVHLCPVSELSTASKRQTMLGTATTGSLMYTDREYTFKPDSLPSHMRGATLIRTACSDKHEGKTKFLQFRVGEACTVQVLYDRRCQSPPAWLTSKFRATSMEACVTHETRKGTTTYCPFGVWTRNVKAGAKVILGGNRAKNADTMYLVVVTEQDVIPSLTATNKRTITSREDMEDSWALGTQGMVLCNPPGGEIWVAVPEGAGYGETSEGGDSDGQDGFAGYRRDAWSDDLAVDAGTSGVFQVKGTDDEVYELALRAESCPGKFRRTTQVTVVPRFCLVNLLEGESIWLKQAGAPDTSEVEIPPGGRLPWHWMLGNRGSKGGVHVRTKDTAWSYGHVRIDRVGTTALHIPFFRATEDFSGGIPPEAIDKMSGEQVVVHMDVKLADDVFSDEYAVLVAFWKANKRFSPIYLVRNKSPVSVRLHQDAGNAQDYKNFRSKAAWIIKPREQRQIGWADPAAPHTLVIEAVGSPRPVELKTDTIGNYAKIATGNARGSGGGPSVIFARVAVVGGTKVIQISAQRPQRGGRKRETGQQEQLNIDEESSEMLKQESQAAALEVTLNLSGFGLSLVAPVSGRRQEIIYAQVSDISAKASHDRLSSIKASVGSIQVDNHLPAALYPVLVSGTEELGDDGSGKRSSEPTPFLELSVIKEVNQATNTDHFDYVAFRMLEVDVTTDRTSVLDVLVQYKPVEGYLQRWRQQLDSRAWVAKRTADILERGAAEVPGGYVDIDEVRRTARIQRKYFKTMMFHPIILRFSYARTTTSNEMYEEAGSAIIDKIPTLMNSHVDLASYIVMDAFGSIKDIAKNVQSHYTLAATSQALNLLGSIRALGSPADLISNVGGSFKVLVYAPTQGLVQGPAEFFGGLGRGAQGFVKGTLHGVTNSVAGVGGAVTDTLSKLSFDAEYQQKREREKHKNMVKQAGVGQSIVQGGKNITGGLRSGVTGIFTAPVSGAKKEGMGGFFKGVGRGLVGAVVKPVVGVTDAAVSIVQGVSNQTGDQQRQKQLRPRRALTRDPETGQLVLKTFSMEAAMAQVLVETGADGSGEPTGDKYESHTSVADMSIIFADTRLLFIKSEELDKAVRNGGFSKERDRKVFSTRWMEVLRVDAVKDGIMIRRYEGGDITLGTTSAANREELYRQFFMHRTRMGDATAMKPPHLVFGTPQGVEEGTSTALTMRARSNAAQRSLANHKFGSVNRMKVPQTRMSDNQVIDRAEKNLQSLEEGNWMQLDKIAWEMVQNWKHNNSGIGSSRFVCVVLINASSTNVQFLELRRISGLGYRLLLGRRCDKTSRQLKPGGVAILCGWAHQQSNILNSGNVAVAVETTAFSAIFTADKEKLSLVSTGGFEAGFLEKTMKEWWCKMVVVVK